MFDRLGAFVSRYRWLILLAWIALAAAVHDPRVAPRWDDITHDGNFAYLPEDMTSVRGEKLMDAAFPDGLSKSEVVLIVARTDGKLQGSDFESVYYPLLQKFAPPDDDGFGDDYEGPITSVWSYETPAIGDMLISRVGEFGQAVLIVLQLRNEFMAVDNMEFIEEIFETFDAIRRDKNFPDGLQLGVSGSAAIGTDFLLSAEESIASTELTTVVLVVVILFVVYRAPGLVIVPLATIGASVVVAKGLVAMLVQWSGHVEWFDLKVFTTTEIFIIVILFGAGTDYCLFLISRYREELQRGLDPGRAIAAALGQVGNALAASALTTVFGLAMMYFADFGKYSNSGPVIALCLLVALAACVTLAPALLSATGRIVFWPFGVGIDGNHRDTATGELNSSLFGRFWQWLSRVVIARPGLILVASVLLMAPLVVVGLSPPITYDLLQELNPARQSVQGTQLLRRHFRSGANVAVTVLARHEEGHFDTPEGQDKIGLLTRELYNLKYPVTVDGKPLETRPIRNVRSLTEPLGGPPGFSLRKVALQKHARAKAAFLSRLPDYAGKVTPFDLIFDYDPFSRESVALLDYIEQGLRGIAAGAPCGWTANLPAETRRKLVSAWAGTQFDFIGTSAGIRDLETVTTSDQLRIQLLVVIAVLAILILILRRPAICVFLILSVLLGYFVTMGITELFFSWLYGEGFHGLDWKVPLFLFVILIAIGEDYNIYLVTRVFEEQKRLGPVEGLRVAVVRTGGIITSCGVIMAGTFFSMTTGTLRTMHELGFALALGVLLDTFVIRTVLVPAFFALWARRHEQRQ